MVQDLIQQPSPPSGRLSRRLSLRSLLLPLGVLTLGWGVCAAVFVSGWRDQRRADAARFNRLAGGAESAILDRIGVYRDALRAGASYLRATTDVTRQGWREFAGSLDLVRVYPGIKGIGVIYPVASADLEGFLDRARADGEPGFSMRTPPGAEAGLRDHALITYIEPQAENSEAVGLDVWSEANRRHAAISSRDLGSPRLTRRIRLVQDGGNRAGFLFYVPVYRAGSTAATLEERRRDHVGWIYAPFVFDELLRGALAERAALLSFRVYEGDDVGPETLLHASNPDTPAGGFERRSRFEIAGLPLTIDWARGGEFTAATPIPQLWTALSGAGATLLLAGLIYSLQTTGRRARQMADERTAEVRAAQHALEELNRLQRAILDGTVLSVISTRPDGVIATFNAGAEKMLGYARDELVGRHTPEILHDRAEVEARAAELSAALGRPVAPGFEVFVARPRLGSVDEQEWTYIRKDGTRLTVWLSITALRDHRGEITGFLGIATDCTARRRAEEKIVRSERLLRTVTDGLPGMVAYWTRDLRCTFSNHAYLDWFGRTSEEMNGIRMQDLLKPRLFQANQPHIQGVLEGKPQQFERTLTKANGETGYTWAQYVPHFAPDGVTVNGFFVFVADITVVKRQQFALRESEERMRLFAEHAPASVAMFDREMRYLVHSRQWLTDHRLPDASLIGRNHYEVFPETDGDWKAVHRRCLAGAIETRAAELRVREDGSRQWLSWEVRPWHTPAGDIGGIVMFSQDITARKELEEHLAKARDEALEASRLKSDFLATMSHEIRTPMNAVMGMASLLADTPLNAGQREMLRAVIGGAEGLLVIINDALDLTRIEAGQLRLDSSEFDLRRVVEETVALLAPSARAKGLALDCAFHPAPDRLLFGDAGRVRQILLNLIGNAVKFTDEGEVGVTLRAGAGADDRRRVRIEVSDTGIGIPADGRERVFEPFVQLDAGSTRRYGGTGLGLAITRQLVTAMGGKLGFESEVGRGSCFWVELEFELRGPLPEALDQGLPADGNGDSPGAGPAPSARAPSGGLRLLLAEDNAANQRVASLLLEQMGHTTEIVGSGAAALERLRERDFDAVLMDCQMPELDGYAATRRIRSGMLPGVNPRVPVIALTAYARPEDRDRCLEAGMDGHVSKPLRKAELQAALQACCAGSVASGGARDRSPRVVLDPGVVEDALRLPGRDGGTLFAELVGLYQRDETAWRDRLARLLAAGQWGELAERAHAFASNASALGAVGVRDAALALEEAARAGDQPQAVLRLAELDQAGVQLRAECERLNVPSP